ncbi:hypothetical protein ACQZV8_06160 [Magnetococcales bacterium HHB-1]
MAVQGFPGGVSFLTPLLNRMQTTDQGRRVEGVGRSSSNRDTTSSEDLVKLLDKDKDGTLSTDEAKGPLKKEFSQFDVDGDSQLNTEELNLALQSGQAQMDGLSTGALQRLIEAHQSGVLTQAPRSVDELLEQLDGDFDTQISESEAKGLLADQFNLVDRDGDGLISTTELKAEFHTMQRGAEPPRGEDLMRSLDGDGDGVLSASEAVGPLAERFDVVDRDGDGVLTQAELELGKPTEENLAPLIPSASEMMPKRDEPRGGRLDYDGDGITTKENQGLLERLLSAQNDETEEKPLSMAALTAGIDALREVRDSEEKTLLREKDQPDFLQRSKNGPRGGGGPENGGFTQTI